MDVQRFVLIAYFIFDGLFQQKFAKNQQNVTLGELLIWKVTPEVVWVHWLTWRIGFKWEYPLCWGVSFKNLAASLGCGRRSRAPRLPSPRLCPPPVGLIFCLNPHRLSFPVACLCVQSYCYLTFRSAALGRIPGQPTMTPDRAAQMTFSGNLSCRNSAPGLKLDVFAV